jgi:hypothetical protein
MESRPDHLLIGSCAPEVVPRSQDVSAVARAAHRAGIAGKVVKGLG